MSNVLRPNRNALAWLLSSVTNSPTAGSGNGACQPPFIPSRGCGPEPRSFGSGVEQEAGVVVRRARPQSLDVGAGARVVEELSRLAGDVGAHVPGVGAAE